MAAIHIVDQISNLRRLKDSEILHEWECGRCAVGADVAEKLIGADLYIHERSSGPSRFGGRITGFRLHSVVEPDGQIADGQIVFRFQATNDHRDIKTPRAGWVKDRKIVW